jgi:hypothetical protein
VYQFHSGHGNTLLAREGNWNCGARGTIHCFRPDIDSLIRFSEPETEKYSWTGSQVRKQLVKYLFVGRYLRVRVFRFRAVSVIHGDHELRELCVARHNRGWRLSLSRHRTVTK